MGFCTSATTEPTSPGIDDNELVRFERFFGLLYFLAFAVLLGACSMVAPGHDGLQRDVDQAVAIIERFEAIPEKAIPPAVMRAARGVAILTVTKVGFIGSVRGGTGIVVSRTDKGWSGPSAIGTGGIQAPAFRLAGLRSNHVSISKVQLCSARSTKY